MAKPKRPRDPNVLAKLIVDIATGEAENIKPVAPREAQRRGGLKGGKARARGCRCRSAAQLLGRLDEATERFGVDATELQRLKHF